MESAEGNGSIPEGGHGDEDTLVDLPVQIPVPEDTELLCNQDYWITKGNKVIRVHNQPRKKAFRPTESDDSPVSPLLLADARVTTARHATGKHWQYTDEWPVNNEEWSKEETWTGLTMFTIEEAEEDQTEEEQTAFHLNQDQCWEYSIFLTQHDMDSLYHPESDQVALLTSTAKKQRAEVRMVDLSREDQQKFQDAKRKEVDQWLDTNGPTNTTIKNPRREHHEVPLDLNLEGNRSQ